MSQEEVIFELTPSNPINESTNFNAYLYAFGMWVGKGNYTLTSQHTGNRIAIRADTDFIGNKELELLPTICHCIKIDLKPKEAGFSSEFEEDDNLLVKFTIHKDEQQDADGNLIPTNIHVFTVNQNPDKDKIIKKYYDNQGDPFQVDSEDVIPIIISAKTILEQETNIFAIVLRPANIMHCINFKKVEGIKIP